MDISKGRREDSHGELPGDWLLMTKSGHDFYYSPSTDISVWERPTRSAPTRPALAWQEAPHPDNPEEETFWFNIITGETEWDPPEEVILDSAAVEIQRTFRGGRLRASFRRLVREAREKAAADAEAAAAAEAKAADEARLAAAAAKAAAEARAAEAEARRVLEEEAAREREARLAEERRIRALEAEAAAAAAAAAAVEAERLRLEQEKAAAAAEAAAAERERVAAEAARAAAAAARRTLATTMQAVARTHKDFIAEQVGRLEARVAAVRTFAAAEGPTELSAALSAAEEVAAGVAAVAGIEHTHTALETFIELTYDAEDKSAEMAAAELLVESDRLTKAARELSSRLQTAWREWQERSGDSVIGGAMSVEEKENMEAQLAKEKARADRAEAQLNDVVGAHQRQHAARIIQAAWRAYSLRSSVEHGQAKRGSVAFLALKSITAATGMDMSGVDAGHGTFAAMNKSPRKKPAATFLKGWLTKRGFSGMKRWHKRYFVFKNSYLAFWREKEEYDAGLPPAQNIALVVTRFYVQEEKNDKHFTLRPKDVNDSFGTIEIDPDNFTGHPEPTKKPSPKSTWFFKCDTPASRRVWVSALQHAAPVRYGEEKPSFSLQSATKAVARRWAGADASDDDD